MFLCFYVLVYVSLCLFVYLETFYFERIVDSHAAERNNGEIPCAFISFLPWFYIL